MSIKKYLKTLSKEQLIEQVIELHRKYDDVKTYYQYFINPADKAVAEKFKRIIRNEFFPLRGGFSGPKLSVARKAVNDFKKLSPPPEDLIDMMLYYAENGVEFTNAYGDIDEPFYNSVAGMFNKAGELAKEHSMEKLFSTRAEKIMNGASNIGWGFHDDLSDTYNNFFSVEEEVDSTGKE